MRKSPQPLRPDGFSLIELMVVVAILSVLVSIAAVSYHLFVTKARVVEGEIVIREVERLEHLYHASNHTYTDNLTNLNFAIAGGLRYYTPEVRMGNTATGVNYSGPRAAQPGLIRGWMAFDELQGRFCPDRPRLRHRSDLFRQREILGEFDRNDLRRGRKYFPERRAVRRQRARVVWFREFLAMPRMWSRHCPSARVESSPAALSVHLPSLLTPK